MMNNKSFAICRKKFEEDFAMNLLPFDKYMDQARKTIDIIEYFEL